MVTAKTGCHLWVRGKPELKARCSVCYRRIASRHNINIRSYVGFRQWARNEGQTNIVTCHCRAQPGKGNLSAAALGVFSRLSLVFSNIFPMLAGSHRNFAQG